MKRPIKWQVTLGMALLALTALVYYLHFLIFRDPHHIFLYFIGDVAFVFFEVLLVTLIIDRLLHHRQQKAAASKLNMLAGAFFSEAGTELLDLLEDLDDDSGQVAQHLAVPSDWSEAAFLNVRDAVKKHRSSMDAEKFDFAALDGQLQKRKPFLLDLLQNPMLLEDEEFTALVWAVFHLAKELEHRSGLDALPPEERQHLAEDAKRVYRLLLVHWAEYMNHLKSAYPYLFALAEKNNPFKRCASVEVK